MFMYVCFIERCRGYRGTIFGSGFKNLSMDGQLQNDMATGAAVVDRAYMS